MKGYEIDRISAMDIDDEEDLKVIKNISKNNEKNFNNRAGKIAEEYLKVIKLIKILLLVVFFQNLHKSSLLIKNLKLITLSKIKKILLKNMNIFDAIIVAVNIENNLDVLKFCLRLKKKFIEKPLFKLQKK